MHIALAIQATEKAHGVENPMELFRGAQFVRDPSYHFGRTQAVIVPFAMREVAAARCSRSHIAHGRSSLLPNS